MDTAHPLDENFLPCAALYETTKQIELGGTTLTNPP
jgi:hypothetical protein